jgi:type I restriction enzyme S subunit
MSDSRRQVKLKDVCKRITVGFVGAMSKEYVEEGVPFLRSLNVRPFKLDLKDLKFVSQEFHLKIRKSALKEGDVVIVRTGAPGTSSVIPKGFDELNCSDLVITTPNEHKLNPHYLCFYFNTLASHYVSSQLVGAIQQHFNIGSAKEMLINLPEIEEQHAVVEFINSINSKIELNNRINAELESMAKLIYDYWFVQFDFPISAAQAAAMGRPELEGKPYKSSGGKMVWNGELKREVPEGWEDGTLDALGEIVGGSTPSRSEESYFDVNGTGWITPKDLSDNKGNKFISQGEVGVSEDGIKAASLKMLPKGTVLLSSRAPIGYLAIAQNELTTNQGFKSFIPNKGYTSEFIFFTVQSSIKVIEQYASGSTFKEISGGVLKSIRTILPTSGVLNQFSEIAQPIFERQELAEVENRSLTAMRDWLLPMLMNGQVRVKEEDGLRMAAEPRGEYGIKRQNTTRNSI